MGTFQDIIGYEAIKNELMQICDMIHNKEKYTAFGAKLPKGIMLYGEPGLGKTMAAILAVYGRHESIDFSFLILGFCCFQGGIFSSKML